MGLGLGLGSGLGLEEARRSAATVAPLKLLLRRDRCSHAPTPPSVLPLPTLPPPPPASCVHCARGAVGFEGHRRSPGGVGGAPASEASMRLRRPPPRFHTPVSRQ